MIRYLVNAALDPDGTTVRFTVETTDGLRHDGEAKLTMVSGIGLIQGLESALDQIGPRTVHAEVRLARALWKVIKGEKLDLPIDIPNDPWPSSSDE